MGLYPLGSAERPARVAVVGAGPAGFYTADALLRRDSPAYAVDLFDRLPTPFGLVRSGVAPDHQKIKNVIKAFERTARHPRFRFLGNVELGRDVSAQELTAHYDQVVYAVGSSSDRRLGIPGEDLPDCHGATAFVGWYNAHPDFVPLRFDLGAERAIIVGVGNVALDVARVLLRSPDELAVTDIPGYSLEALRSSRIREVVLLARRGGAQVAFDPGELLDIRDLRGVGVSIDPAQVEPDMAHLAELQTKNRKNVELMLAIAREGARSAERRLRIELLASPVEILADDRGRMRRVRVERNVLVPAPGGPKARGTGSYFEIEAGALFRSVGYRAVPLPGVPFDEKAGIIPNVEGRVTDGARIVPGAYAVGWIRRGPTGVIGTNKADAHAVAAHMVEDVLAATDHAPAKTGIDALLSSRGVRVVGWLDWLVIDELEMARGRRLGKVRDKIETVDAMLSALDDPEKRSGFARSSAACDSDRP